MPDTVSDALVRRLALRGVRSLGLLGIAVDRPDDVPPAWEQALAADRPMLLEAVVDPNVPAIPPHVSGSHMRNLFSSLLHGDPSAFEVMKASFRQLMS